jgi:hypothetical protein
VIRGAGSVPKCHGSATLVYNIEKKGICKNFGVRVLWSWELAQVVQGAASLARLADSAGESSSPSTDSDSSSDEDSEYEIEDIYQVFWLFFQLFSVFPSPGSKVTWKSTLQELFICLTPHMGWSSNFVGSGSSQMLSVKKNPTI